MCCNDVNKTADGGAGLNVSLAAYLMNADNRSLFGPGSHWANVGWDTVFANFPQLTRPLGPPLGRFTRDGRFRFSRRFAHLEVELDCHPAPACAGHTDEASCDGDRSGACEWLKQWAPPGAPGRCRHCHSAALPLSRLSGLPRTQVHLWHLGDIGEGASALKSVRHVLGALVRGVCTDPPAATFAWAK